MLNPISPSKADSQDLEVVEGYLKTFEEHAKETVDPLPSMTENAYLGTVLIDVRFLDPVWGTGL